jgi:hypothetical protein
LLIDEAAAWGQANHVPVICNEFGVYREHSDPGSRAQWIHDVRTALEADEIGWAMWDYRGGFEWVLKEEASRRAWIRAWWRPWGCRSEECESPGRSF